MTIREEITHWVDYLLAKDAFDMDLRREVAIDGIEGCCRSWALEETKEVRERLVIAYRNGKIDGKQGTDCEDVVVNEAISYLRKRIEEKQ